MSDPNKPKDAWPFPAGHNGRNKGRALELAKRESRTIALALSIADHAAASDIECNTVCATPGTGVEQRWWDTNSVAPDHQEVRELIAESVEYLDLRGLLERDRDAPHIVRIKHELMED